ncbi:hypothetical protein [Roseomonas rosulenta]|uniref:hypothetical protein n=1 Tax=Roseomonas rosulenta TaxID=2748667 RepID=UPI0018DF047E|nr:hypothetical protein [Roseomonas rosulenta]
MTSRRALFGLDTAATVAALVLGLAGAAQAQTTDPSFRLNNRSNQTIMEIYVSSSADSNWGRDHLGANVLPPGQSFVVRLPDGQCVNDIRIVVEGGRNIDRMQINTCNLTDINYP